MIGLKELAKLLLTGAAAAELAQLGVPGTWRPLHEAIGQEKGIDPDLLHALQLQENYQGDATAVGVNRNASGAELSRDYGLMQINTVNLVPLGLVGEDWRDPPKNIRAAAELLRRNMAAAPQLGVLSQLSVYNAGFSQHRDAKGQLRAKQTADGLFTNQKYVLGAATWYALIKLAAFAPIRTTGWAARAA